MSYVRTAKHRVMRSQMIHQWKPWLKSTGAKTEEGKAVSSMNAYKGGVRQKQRELNKQLNEQMQAILNLLD
jgi:BMFP domain-containing protein YqiC